MRQFVESLRRLWLAGKIDQEKIKALCLAGKITSAEEAYILG